MLKLAEWYQTHLTKEKGAEECENPEKGRYPPAPKQTGDLTRTALGESTSRSSTTNDKAIESDCETAPPVNCDGKGGE